MEARVVDALHNEGIEAQKTIERFVGNDAMYERFLGMFPKDESYSWLERSMADKNMHEAMKGAHTLKSLAANLGMVQLSALCEVMERKLRADAIIGLEEDFGKVKAEYRRVLAVLENVVSFE